MALTVGFLAPVILPGIKWQWLEWMGMRHVYSESLFFMALVVAGAILSGPVGVMLLLGYVAGILVVGSDARYAFSAYPFRRSGGLLVSYLLLAIPAVIVPLAARRMSEEVRLPRAVSPQVRMPVRTLLYAIACAIFVFLWCQAMIVLIRPVFTWVWSAPSVEAVLQVQRRWGWLVAVAVVAAVTRMVLEEVVRRSLRGEFVADLGEERWAAAEQRGERWSRLPLAARIGLASGVVTLLLAGAYTSWIDAVVVMAVTAALGVWSAGLVGSLPAGWARLILRVPVLVRFVVATWLGYQLATLLIQRMWHTDTMRPVALGSLLTMLIVYLVFPGRPASPSTTVQRGEA